MNITGPIPPSLIPRTDETSLGLRLNERLAAEVLKVTGDRVTLALEGIQVVAQLTNPEQAEALAERRHAQFLVKDLSGPVITLQLVKEGEARASPAPTQTDLILSLLKASGLPEDATTLAAARALIQVGLPVTPELLEELKKALKGLDGRGAGLPGGLEAEVRLAAALKAAGLPISPEILKMMAGRQQALSGLLLDLRTELQRLLDDPPTAETADQARAALHLLDSLQVQWDEDTLSTAEGLRQALGLLGQPVERRLAEAGLEGLDGTAGLACLARLRCLLAESGAGRLLDTLDRFLDQVRALQFLNAPPDTALKEGGWLKLEAVLIPPSREGSQTSEETHPRLAHLRIARSPEGYHHPIDPSRTRLVLAVDLENGDQVQVDLAIVERRVGMKVLASTDELLLRAEEERASLEAGLEKLGFSLQTASFNLGIRDLEDPLENGLKPLPDYEPAGGGIDVEV